jgi:hypothetical protein
VSVCVTTVNSFPYLLFVFFLLLETRVWLCSPGWPLILGPPVFASQVLGLQVCTTTPSFIIIINTCHLKDESVFGGFHYNIFKVWNIFELRVT